MIEQIETLRRDGRFAEISDLMPYAHAVGLEVSDGDDGLITALRARPGNIGNTMIPAVHGGVVGALLEHAAILLVLKTIAITDFPKIIDLSVDYLRPCLGGRDTFAKGVVVKVGRNVVNVRVEAWQEDPGRLVAAAHAHFLLVNEPGSPGAAPGTR